MLHPGRAASLFLEGKKIGRFGQIHPSTAVDFEVNQLTYIFDIELEPMLQSAIRTNKWTSRFKTYATVPFMERDISMVVDKGCTAHQIVSLIRKSGKPLLESVDLIDRYEGNNVPDNKVSQAFRIRYRDTKKTLKDTDINPIHNRIRETLMEKIGADLRS